MAQSREDRFRLTFWLLLVILGSWVIDFHEHGFDWSAAVSHLLAALIVISIADREIAICWFEKLTAFRRKE